MIPNTNRHNTSKGESQFHFQLVTPEGRVISVPFYRDETIGHLKVRYLKYLASFNGNPTP